MSKKQFENLILPLFKIKSENSHTETFYDISEHHLMMNNCWIKEESSFTDETLYSIKQFFKQDETLNYKERRFPEKSAEIEELLQSKRFSYSYDVISTCYELRTNNNVILRKDYVNYNDFSSFVQLSIVGPVPVNWTTEIFPERIRKIVEFAKPCRTKIMELFFRTNDELYRNIIHLNPVMELEYESMCVATFQQGKEKALEYRIQAEESRQQSIKDGIDPLLINYDYSTTLMYGIDSLEEHVDYYYS